MKRVLLSSIASCIVFLSANASDDLFKENRQKLMSIVSDGIILVPSANDFDSWASDKNFLYLTGLNVSNSILGLNPIDGKEILFIDDDSRWDLPKDCNLDMQPLNSLPDFIRKNAKVYLPIARLNDINSFYGKTNIFRNAESIINITPIIYNLRLIKSAEEVSRIENAIKLTGSALTEAFKQCKKGNREVDVYAQIQYQAIKDQVKTSFYQIASGSNSTNVHFDYTDRAMKSKETVVFDLGIFYKYYTSDISRTYPVDGKFTNEQKQIYTIVLNAQKVGISLMKPGSSYDFAQKRVKEELVKGLFELGLITDTTSNWQKEFYILHGFSHGIGLDVHDVYYYYRDFPNKKYLSGMVYSMEPGLYFPEDMEKSIPERLKGKVSQDEFDQFVQKVGSIYRKYANIGVRIEDDILITDDGNRVLSAMIPKEIKDIEGLVK